ncbi:MAG: hypothetical protein WCP12_16400, partial [bacterium]
MTTLIRIQKQMTVVVAVCLMGGAHSAWATDYTWTGPLTGGNWTTASNNWNAAATPVWDSVNGPGNSAVFTNAVTVADVVGSLYLSNLTFNAACSLNTAVDSDTLYFSPKAEITTTGNTYIYQKVSGADLTFNVNVNGNNLRLGNTSNPLSGTVKVKSSQTSGNWSGLFFRFFTVCRKNHIAFRMSV